MLSCCLQFSTFLSLFLYNLKSVTNKDGDQKQRYILNEYL